jgi:hypothetical protein
MRVDSTDLETAGRANIPWQKQQQQQEMQNADAEEWWTRWWSEIGEKGDVVRLKQGWPIG